MAALSALLSLRQPRPGDRLRFRLETGIAGPHLLRLSDRETEGVAPHMRLALAKAGFYFGLRNGSSATAFPATNEDEGTKASEAAPAPVQKTILWL
ncbi:hypothetical protein C7I85_28290 [Mesorhizobium soli]|uniref:Uncharacterized protein n=1 Tax=Pseudaminobacter soli (ex Li et al. 2025) TaxID=1295366 RepID=A0A2P7RSK4_9HYPH|nr:hypothetical protein C7I85_28290 [Mesorhizobium soli]